MTPEEIILTLRICGEHPKYKDFTCRDCPWIQNCDHDGGGRELNLRTPLSTCYGKTRSSDRTARPWVQLWTS